MRKRGSSRYSRRRESLGEASATFGFPMLAISLLISWTPVVRYDHDEGTDHGGHDVTGEFEYKLALGSRGQ